MRKVLTIQIVRPEVENLSPAARKLLIDEIARGIAEQIVFQEEMHIKNENIKYWQQRLIDWEIEDRINEIKYGQLRSDIKKS